MSLLKPYATVVHIDVQSEFTHFRTKLQKDYVLKYLGYLYSNLITSKSNTVEKRTENSSQEFL